MPAKVAIGTIRAASSTFSAGTVADSRPRNPQNVSPAAVAICAPVTATCGCATVGAPRSHNTTPSPISAASGTSLITVVTSEISPALRTPRILTPVNSHTTSTDSTAGNPGTRPITGKIGDRLLTTATASAPLPAHSITQ